MIVPAVLSVYIDLWDLCSERPPRDTSGLFVCVMRNGRPVASWFAHHMVTARQRITASCCISRKQDPFLRRIFFCSSSLLLFLRRREGKKLERTFGDNHASLLITVWLLHNFLVHKVPKAFQRNHRYILIIILTFKIV